MIQGGFVWGIERGAGSRPSFQSRPVRCDRYRSIVLSINSDTSTLVRETHVEGRELHPGIFQIFDRKTEVGVEGVCHC